MMTTVVAIDGPSASGKSSTAKAVARALGFRHLDSGALYRGVTLAAIRAGLSRPYADADVVAQAHRLAVGLEAGEGGFDVVMEGSAPGRALREADVTARVSEVAALPGVRDWVNARLRDAAADGQAVVVDGRDIGSVVFPEAQLKVFLTASPEARAQRRLQQRGDPVHHDEMRREAEVLAARDQADSTREVAPLLQADDAVPLDTSDLTFERQVERIVELALERGLGQHP